MTMAPALLDRDSNEHMWDRRWKKAHELAGVLFAHGFPSSEVESIDEAAWEAVAAQATLDLGRKVHPPHSQDTIDCVFDCLRKLENAADIHPPVFED